MEDSIIGHLIHLFSMQIIAFVVRKGHYESYGADGVFVSLLAGLASERLRKSDFLGMLSFLSYSDPSTYLCALAFVVWRILHP